MDLILVGSITNAFKAKEVLKKNGLRAFIVKINSDKEGCGYTVHSPNKTNEAIKILNNNKIKILGRFPSNFRAK